MLWLLAGDERISGVRDEIEDARTTVVVSAVVIWEVTIKQTHGKLTAPEDFPRRLDPFAFERLPVDERHAWAVRDLPPVHGDPFDRLLAAQAKVEKLTVVSKDTIFDCYDVARRW